MRNNSIVLIGGGGHCKACIDVIEQQREYDIIGILDLPENFGNNVLGYPIIGDDSMLEELVKKGFYFIITIGQIGKPGPRMLLYNKLKANNAKIATVISNHAYVSKYSTIGEGSIILHNSVVQADVTIGCNCIINDMALIEHDVIIEDHCHIATAAVVNGGVKIGEGCFVGSNAVIKQYTSIKEYSFIKANSIKL